MTSSDSGLMNQTDARREAREANESDAVPDGLIAIAQPVPAGSWGGYERGWTVAYVPKALYEKVPEPPERLSLIGRERVMIETFTKALHKEGRSHDHTPIREIPRGNWFEVLLDDGRVARVTVVLDRIEEH